MQRQSITSKVINHHTERRMSIALDATAIEDAKALAREVEWREMQVSKCKLPAARKNIATRIGCAPGRLFNLARDRLKTISAGFIERLHADNVRLAEIELKRARNAMDTAVKSRMAGNDAQILRLESAINDAAHVLEKAKSVMTKDWQ